MGKTKGSGFRFQPQHLEIHGKLLNSLRDGDTIDVSTFRSIVDTKVIVVPKINPKTNKPFKQVKDQLVFEKQILEKEIAQKRVGTAFFIPGQVPSWKNSHQILRRPLTAAELITAKKRHSGNTKYRYFIGKSDNAQKYEKQAMHLFRERAEEFRQLTAGMTPVIVEFLFVNKTKRLRWDFVNYAQGIADMMVRAGWIVDDSIDNLIVLPPLEPGKTWSYDQSNPGVMITVLKIRSITLV